MAFEKPFLLKECYRELSSAYNLQKVTILSAESLIYINNSRPRTDS